MFEELLEQIDRLITLQPLSRDVLSAYRRLVVLMEDAKPEPVVVPLEDRLRDRRRERTTPLFSPAELPVDRKGAAKLLRSFLSQGVPAPAGRGKGTGYDDDWALKAVGFLLDGDGEGLAGAGREAALDPGALGFLTRAALDPFLSVFRTHYSHYVADWDRGYCPLCGSAPHMACLDHGGRRHLRCGLCGHEWPHDRLRCPFCRNDDQRHLGYFQSEQDRGLRVDFCRRCGRYIKTVDRRSFLADSCPLELVFLASLHLDSAAESEGFR